MRALERLIVTDEAIKRGWQRYTHHAASQTSTVGLAAALDKGIRGAAEHAIELTEARMQSRWWLWLTAGMLLGWLMP